MLTVDVPSAAIASNIQYADLLAAQLPEDLYRPVVAAHSAAGLLLPALAARLDADHQIWMAAPVPDHAGQRSLLDDVRTEPAALFQPERVGVDPTIDPVLATYFLFHDADLATLNEALPTVAGCGLSAICAETPPVSPTLCSSTYLLPAGDRALRSEAMYRMSRDRPAVEPVLLPGGHNNYVGHARPVVGR